MPITAIKFDEFFHTDIHLVRGTSAAGQTSKDLRDELQLTLPNGDTVRYLKYLENHNDVEILFEPLFKPQSDTTTEAKGFGITVNKKTGRINVKGQAPATAPATFIVEASVKKNTGGVAPATIAIAFLRVHVHQQVERVRLSPKRISTRSAPGSDFMTVDRAFTVRAEFDDGTVADVVDSGQLTFTPASFFKAPPWLNLPASASPGQSIPITVKTSPQWNSLSDDAVFDVLDTWDNEPNIPTAELIEGHPKVWDGVIRPEEVPNVIIVGCGFTKDDRTGFEEITNLMVHQLKTDKMLKPYAYLATSMNFWRLMIPAVDAGVSVRSEVAQFLLDGKRFARPIWMPEKPPAALADWSLVHLIYAVGLPVQADLKLVTDAAQHQIPTLDDFRTREPRSLDFSALFKKWTAVARPVPGVNFANVTPERAHEWLALADRTFVDEVDGFPTMSIGEPPAAGKVVGVTSLSLHFYRDSREERDAFFPRVTATPRPGIGPIALDGPPPGNALGNLWSTDPATRPAFKFDNRDFIVMLGNTPSGRANAGINLSLSLYSQGVTGNVDLMTGVPVKRVAGQSSLTLENPKPAALSYDNDTALVFAHELTHKFGLGDEYDEFHTTSTHTAASISGWANLTTPGTFQNADGSVRVEDIKWNWHRIRKASVLTAPLHPVSGLVYHAYIRRTGGLRFEVGNKVRLRKRERRKVIDRPTVTSAVEFKVTEVHKTNPDDPNDTQNMMLVLEADGAVDVAPFGADSLIYIPVPAPAAIASAARPYLTLVPPAAERIMAKIGGILNGKTCTPATAANDTVPLEKDPDGKVNDLVLPSLVGAYFSGGQFACGIAHPAGMCSMNASSYTPSGVPEGVSALCPVCRYVLVDQIDPEKHFLNDLDYDSWFPL